MFSSRWIPSPAPCGLGLGSWCHAVAPPASPLVPSQTAVGSSDTRGEHWASSWGTPLPQLSLTSLGNLLWGEVHLLSLAVKGAAVGWGTQPLHIWSQVWWVLLPLFLTQCGWSRNLGERYLHPNCSLLYRRGNFYPSPFCAFSVCMQIAC